MSFLWVADKSDDMVYKYDLAGVPLSAGDFALAADNRDPEGITTDGSSIWVVDRSDDKVYVYDMAGNYVSGSDFALAAANDDPRGITTDGSSIWVLDHDDRVVYKYTSSGAHVPAGDFPLGNPNDAGRGITTFGSSIWILDQGDGLVYDYDLVGSLRAFLPMDGSASTSATLFNYDTNNDDDPEKFQEWRTVPLAQALLLEEDSVLGFWSFRGCIGRWLSDHLL